MIPGNYVFSVAFFITLVYASYLDIKTRVVPFKTWTPIIAIGIVYTSEYLITMGYFVNGVLWGLIVVLFLYARFNQSIKLYHILSILIVFGVVAYFLPSQYILFLCLICGLFYTLGCLNVIGGADAWVLIFITLFSPENQYLSITVFIIAVFITVFCLIIVSIIKHLSHSDVKSLLITYKIPFIIPITVGYILIQIFIWLWS